MNSDLLGSGVFIFHQISTIQLSHPIVACQKICDALQQNRKQVAQAYFEVWTIEVPWGVKNNSSVNFKIFDFFT